MVKQAENKSKIITLRVNRLRGRMLTAPATANKRKNVLIVYGLHSSLERWQDLAEDLSKYGNVTMPDLPGFGGMQSFYHINEKASIDRLADYLAAFVKLKYKNKRVTVVGLSAGFAVVTRMCQKYPDIAKKFDRLVGLGPISHIDDYAGISQKRPPYRMVVALAKTRAGSLFAKFLCYRGPLLRLKYSLVYDRNRKTLAARMSFTEYYAQHRKLWRQNDLRTHMAITHELLHLNNCRQQVNVPTLALLDPKDPLLEEHVTEQHLRVIFGSLRIYKGKGSTEAGIMSEVDRPVVMLPAAMRRAFVRK